VELQHTFTVPAPVEQAWATLLDVEGIAPCFPGAALTGVDGDEFSGTVKVKLGPVSLQYAGKGRFVERDEAARRVLLEANGSDKRGNGTAGATVTARLEPEGDSATRVVVDTDLKVTGRPAQFGRGMLQDVGGKIIDQFATCLASRIAAAAPVPDAEPSGAAPPDAAPPDAAPPDAAAPHAAAPDAAAPDASASATESVAVTQQAGAGDAEPVAAVPDASASASESAATHPAPLSTPGPSLPSVPGQEAPASPPAELDLGAVVLPALAKRYGPGVLAGLVAVLVVWLLRRRSH
jgi:carbon monoxide dehydrogenase subunit G